MIFNLVGGGGANLNFQVVGGTTEPTNPKENTIWINTSEEIQKFVFSPATPIDTVEGLAWIKTGTSGEIVVNALKQDAIMLYLNACKQYRVDNYVGRIASIYQNGEWKQFSTDWDKYYFKNGDQCTDITGGWTSDGYTYGSYAMRAGTIGDKITISTTEAVSASVVGTVNAVDITDISKLYVTVDSLTSGYTSGYIKVCTDKSATVSAKETTLSVGTVELDVSDITGEHYICIVTVGGNTIPNTEVVISAIYSE